jgi:NAD(P)-dependent dehydrogenase (short-subunit alcohol dehydrogenase family)
MLDELKPLRGKVALVTGGSRGIGASISRKLGACGCELYVNYVEHDVPARALAAELELSGIRVTLAKADVTDAAEIDAMLGRIREAHGYLDILVHNAASSVFGELSVVDERQWRFTFDANVRSLLLLAQRARPLLAGRGGRLITMSNLSAVSHFPRNAVFGAAKAAVESLTRSLADELACDGVVVNCLRPDMTANTGVLEVRSDFRAVLERQARESPWHRTTTPEDVANATALLCLDEAAWICGQTLTVDGGWTRRR